MAYRWNPQPLTCRVYIMRKGLQRGVSQRHRVVMTCQTIIHYHQLEINSELQRQILEAQKHQFLHQKSSCGDLVKKILLGGGTAPSPEVPPPQTHPPVRRRTPFPTPHSPRRLRGLEALDSCACSAQPRYVPHPHHFLHPQVFIF